MPRFKNGLAKVGRYWHYQFKVGGKVYHGSTGHESLEAAKTWLRIFREDVVNSASGILPRAKIPTLGTATNEWETWAKAYGKSPSHTRNTTKDVRKHFADLLDTKLHLITTAEVRAAIAAYLDKGNTLGGANGILRSLNSVIGWSIRQGYIQKKPYEVKPERIQATPSVYLPTSRLAEFFAVMRKQGASENAIRLAQLMVGLGLRESEARNARVEHTNLERHEFTPWDPVAGTKGKEADPLPIPEWLLPHLAAWIGDRKQGLIIPGRYGTAHKREYALPYLTAAGAEMGIPGLTCHKLRATYATLLSEEGLPLQTIQRALRHKDSRTTMKYLVPDLGAIRAAANRIGDKSGLSTSMVTPENAKPFKSRKKAT